MSILEQTSIIVPIAPKETSWRELIKYLNEVKFQELILVGANVPTIEEVNIPHNNLKIIKSAGGRAVSQNIAANAAIGKYLWFIHADSQLPPEIFPAIEKGVEPLLSILYYFTLKFMKGDSRLMRITELGTKVRSDVLGIPFGDQGFFLKREIFFELGGFDEKAMFGEDHLLVWRAKGSKIPIRRLASPIYTSARKYRGRWFKTTFLHLRLTLQQALPEFIKNYQDEKNK